MEERAREGEMTGAHARQNVTLTLIPLFRPL